MTKVSKNVYIIGTQSTGKTYLVEELKKHRQLLRSLSRSSGDSSGTTIHNYSPHFITEVARTVLRTFNFSRDDIKSDPARCLELQRRILEAQYDAEQQHAGVDDHAWYICDRSALDPIVYASMYLNQAAVESLLGSQEWKASEVGMKQGLVFLLEPVREWCVDDGTRLMVDWNEQLQMNKRFKQLLEEKGITYQSMTGEQKDIRTRVDMVVDALRKDMVIGGSLR